MYFSKKYSLKKVGIVMILSLALLLSCILMIYSTNKHAEAILSNSANATYIGELLLNSDGERIGSKVFNGNILEKLYSRLSINNSTSFKDVEDAASAIPAQTNNELRSGKTANQLRSTNSDGNSTVVTLGGMNWLVTSLTKDRNGDVIVTLWLENTPNSSDYQTTWNAWTTDSNVLSSTYLPTGYSTSYIRSYLLNGYSMTDSLGNSYPTQYSTGTSNPLTTLVAQSTYKYDIFTNVNNSKNITDYIVKPEQIEYQETEYLLSNATLTGVNGVMQNDAYGTPAGGVWYNSGGRNMNLVTQKARYSEWKYDYLWLPSLVETGWNDNYDGIWGLNNTERANTAGTDNISYLRSGNWDKLSDVLDLSNSGGIQWNSPRTKVGAVRPAFHLNLSLAEQSSAYIVDVPADFSVDYNGDPQG
ncbi:MAG: hypothetical protein K2O35_03410, partial [Clostridia bacterium]|nr:hypothetical protein [Clostridia bacterium]